MQVSGPVLKYLLWVRPRKKEDNERCNAFYVFLYVEKDMHACKTQSRSTSGLNSSLVDPPEGDLGPFLDD